MCLILNACGLDVSIHEIMALKSGQVNFEYNIGSFGIKHIIIYAFWTYIQGHTPPAVLFHRDMSQKHIL